ncbi:MAG: hypothetical protein NTZ60_12420 [Campylobacterales bacterium]|nr:hypothetical protein [Campylobacterales bacterium]
MKNFNLFSRMIAVLGVLMMFAVSGWGVCGTSNGNWIPSATATTGSVTTTNEYYTIAIASAGTLNISVQNTYSSSGTRTLTATLYPDNGQCNTASIWNTSTIVKNTTQSSGDLTVSAGTYTLKLVSSSSSSTGYSLTGTFTPSPTVSITPVTLSTTEGSSGITNAPFTVTLSATPTSTATVAYATAGSSTNPATSGTDFTATSGTLTFAAGTPTLTQTINVPIIGDTVYENNETYTVTLSSPSGATLGTSTATGTITNDDAPPIVSITPTTLSTTEGNSSTTNTIYRVALSASSGVAVTVPYTVAGSGTNPATSGTDFTATSGTVTFAVGTTTLEQNITVPIIGDAIYENNETYTLTLSPTNATPTTLSATGTIINDDVPTADLQITKTAPASVMAGNQIQYTLSITNKGPNETDLNMTDILDANLTYLNAYDDAHEWVCTYATVSRKLSCQHPNLMIVNAAPSIITILATAPSAVMSVPNSASVLGTLPDLNTSNNTSSASISVVASSFSNSNPRDFALQKQYNTPGNMQIIGNSIMRDATTHACAAAGIRNNNITVEYVDVDANATTFNSSTANITLPTGATSNDIAWAGLYWQGYLVSQNDANKTSAKNVLFKTPTSSNYVSLTSDTSKFNWVYFDDAKTRWYYQGGQDVTSYVKSGLSGTYTVANVPSQTGGGINGGGFGAWALIVLYKDNNATLKNMSVYDGYVGISSADAGRTGVYASTAIPLSGFFTPPTGNVNSEFMTFVGEGDTGVTGDFGSLSNNSGLDISLKNALNPVDDLFNSTISNNGVSVTTRNPNCANNIGIDIDAFDVGSTATTPTTQGQIIQNGQTTTNVKLTSSGDGYFPGAFAFSTELYAPDVCYLETVSYGGNPIASSNTPIQGSTVDYEVSITNKSNDEAKRVVVEKTFDQPSQMTYKAGSIQIAPIPGTAYSSKSDSIGDDTAEYSAGTSRYYLGDGASSGTGGALIKDALTKFKYQVTLGDQNASENIYSVSYRNDLLHITFTGVPIRKCVDFNNSFAIGGVAGAFNAVPTSFSGTNDPLTGTDPLNALSTQVSNQNFSVKIVSLNTDNITLKAYTGNVNVSIINTPSYVAGDDAGNQVLCNNATPINTTQTTTFSGESSKDLLVTNTAVATKNASFKIAYDLATTPKYACSRDIFAIRPNEFNSAITPNQTFVAQHNTPITFRADQYGGVGTINYNEMVNTSFTVDLNISDSSKTCSASSISFSPNINFVNGSVTSNYALNNVGDFNLTIHEKLGSEFALVDALDTPSITRLITPFLAQIKVIPDHFLLAGNLTNSGSNFTYFSNFEEHNDTLSRNMSASLDMNITAQGELDTNLSNYTSLCYAKDGNLTITLPNPLTVTPAGSLTKLLWYESLHDINGSVPLSAATSYIMSMIKAQFNSATNGTSTVKYLINFDRNQTFAANPLMLNIHNTNYTDSDTAQGNQILDKNATFVYGRSHAPRQRFSTPTGTALMYYESYCNGCDKTLLPNSIDSNMTDDPRWFINTLHTNSSGNAGTVTQKNSLNIVTVNTQPVGNHPDSVGLTYNTTKGYPYKTTMENNASSWLIYNKYNTAATKNEFEIEFEGADSNWSGKHETNTTTIRSGTDKTNRRTMW